MKIRVIQVSRIGRKVLSKGNNVNPNPGVRNVRECLVSLEHKEARGEAAKEGETRH